MKSVILACLLMLFESSPSFGDTDCKTQEYSDRTEVVCIGDGKVRPEANSPAKSSQVRIAENVAPNQVQTPPQAPVPSTPVESPPQATATTVEKTQQTTAGPALKPETAVEHLNKRRGLATRNARSLSNFTSASAPQGQ